MQIYSVGGFVRDKLLREEFGVSVPEVGDRDWVVVGSSPEEMLKLGYLPVGSDFPVFLHPVTHEEYALARTERKTAPGYHGFVFHADPNITLEEDLRRRDLTINAMALSEDGTLIDPYGGRRDLAMRTLRHVSEAFSEDPVRILRIARFAARFGDFQIAPDTLLLMRQMVLNGEADALVPERIWAELSRAMAHDHPLKLIDTLAACGLWEKIFPRLPLPDPELREALGQAAATGLCPDARIALLFSGAPSAEDVLNMLKKLRAPSSVQQLSECFSRILPLLQLPLTTERLAEILEKSDALRRPERMLHMIKAWEVLNHANVPQLREGVDLWRSVDAGAIATRHKDRPASIPHAVREARIRALARLQLQSL